MFNYKMLGDIFVKIFKFPMNLYSFWTILAIFRIIKKFPKEFELIDIEKKMDV